jgi:hypothetical protein
MMGAAFSSHIRRRPSSKLNSAYEHSLDILICSKGGKFPGVRALRSPILNRLNSISRRVLQGVGNYGNLKAWVSNEVAC